LDRTPPLLPMRPGQLERRTQEYVRYGTTSLFAALDVKTHRHRPLSSPPSCRGVPQVPRYHRRHDPAGPQHSSDPRQLCHAQNTAHPAVVEPAALLSSELHADGGPRGSTSSNANTLRSPTSNRDPSVDEDGRRDSRQRRALLSTGLGLTRLAAYFFPKDSKPNFWPPTLASAIRPPLPWVKTATPSWYLASFDAPAEAATALT
jgi:hypothetical protein